MPRKYTKQYAQRFPAKALIDHLIGNLVMDDGKPATPYYAADLLGVSRGTIYGWLGKDFKFTIWQADRYACRIGEHPSVIWPDLYWQIEEDRVTVVV